MQWRHQEHDVAFTIAFFKTLLWTVQGKIMTYHLDTRWRIVCLMHCYDMDVHFLHDIFGPTPRTIQRWHELFKTKGVVGAQEKKQTRSRWPEEALQAVANYCKNHPNFFSGGTTGPYDGKIRS